MKKTRILLATMLFFTLTIFVGCEDYNYNNGVQTATLGDVFECNWTSVDESESGDIMVNEDGFVSLPIIYIEAEHDRLTKEYEDCTISVFSYNEEYTLIKEDAKIKVRGNQTSNFSKAPYRIKFNKKQSMLGLNDNLKAKSWVLLAEFTDRTMLKNLTALNLAKQILGEDGYYVSDCKLVEVYINGNYQGVYLLAEQQQVNKKRVNITEPDDDYTGTDIGYLLEMDAYYEGEEYYFEMDFDDLVFIGGETIGANNFERHYVIKSDIYSENQKQFANDRLQNVWDVAYDAVFNDHTEHSYLKINDNNEIIEDDNIQSTFDAVSNVIDVNSLVDMFILHEICEDLDIGLSSFYMSFDFGTKGNKKLTFQAPWDFDWALGQKRYVLNDFYTCARPNSLYRTTNPWFLLFCNQDWFMDMVAQKVQLMSRQNVFDNIINMINKYCEDYEMFFDRNFEVWPECLTFVLNTHTSEEYENATTQKEAADWLIEFLEARRDFLFSHFIPNEQGGEVIIIQN